MKIPQKGKSFYERTGILILKKERSKCVGGGCKKETSPQRTVFMHPDLQILLNTVFITFFLNLMFSFHWLGGEANIYSYLSKVDPRRVSIGTSKNGSPLCNFLLKRNCWNAFQMRFFAC
jgi:hypothetical protein